jgi:hypothetical protein
MDSEIVAVAARHLERLLIVLAGALSIVLGYRMFLAIPRSSEGPEAGEGKLELPGGVSIYVTRVGPGVFFALFGAVILALGLYHGLSVEVRQQQPGAVAAEGTPGGVVMERRMSSAVPAGASGQQQEAERTGALGTVAQLGRLAAALDAAGDRGLSQQQRLDFGLALADARARLLAAVWDDRAWGPYTDFARWLQEGESGPPPPRAATAARAYRGER